MNEKFFALPKEKQQRIINAGYRVFSQNSYKKSPMGEIAAEAGISKSLLFHYFYNKRELYLYLWEEACWMTKDALEEERCYEPDDLFEMMRRGMVAKMQIMRNYPNLTGFVMKAFYEKEPGISQAIQESYRKFFGMKASDSLLKLNPEQFRRGLDLNMIIREMYWAAEGYLWEELQKGPLDIEKLGRDFEKLLAFWQKAYGREDEA